MEFNSHPLEESRHITLLKVERPGKDQLFRSLNRRYGDFIMDDKCWYWIMPTLVPAQEKVVIRLSRELDLAIFSDSESQQIHTRDYLLKLNPFLRHPISASFVRTIGYTY